MFFEDDNGWVESCLPVAECVALHYPLCWVTGNGTLASRWHCLGPCGLMGPFRGWGWVKGEEMQPTYGQLQDAVPGAESCLGTCLEPKAPLGVGEGEQGEGFPRCKF